MEKVDAAVIAGPGPGVIEVRCPADGRIVGEVRETDAREIDELCAGLLAAQPDWERLGLKSEPLWYPIVPAKSRLISRATRLLGAHDWRRRLGRPVR